MKKPSGFDPTLADPTALVGGNKSLPLETDSGKSISIFLPQTRKPELTDVLRFPCKNFQILVQKFLDSDKISSRSNEISIGSGKISPTFCCFLKSLTLTNLPATYWRSNPPNPISLSISNKLMATPLNQVWLDSG